MSESAEWTEIGPVWIVKHAASTGIKRVERATLSHGRMLTWYPKSNQVAEHAHGEGVEWCRTEEEAQVRGRNLLAARLASLRRQCERMEKLFGAPVKITTVTLRDDV